MKRIIKNSVTSSKETDPQSEYEYRKNIYLKRKHEFETLGEDDNNDVLSREEKMNIAKAEMDKVNPKSSNVKASEDDYNPYSFMVGDQLEWSGLYGGQYKGLVTNVNDEYVTVEVMRTAEDSGDTIIDTQKFEIVTDPEGKECIIVWTYGSHAGYVYPPSNDYINSAYEYSGDALWDVIDDEEFEFRGVQDVGYDNDGNIMVVFNHAISETMIEPTAEELLMAFRQYGYPVHEWNTNGANVFILSRGGILSSTNSRLDQKVSASQSYLDRIEELMEQGLDEETASREAYAEFYPDEYDADDYDDSIYSSNSSKAFTGYVRTLCNNCGHLNRVKVIFPEFNKPFEDTNYKCESCGAINELTDPHVYDEDGYIISSTISSKLDKIRAKLLKAVHDVMTSSEFGFLDDEVEDYSAVEIVPVNDNMICIEVRAEVDYDGLWMLKEVCDPIIQKYYPDAYFVMETAGVMQAYISKDVPIKSASNDTYYMQLKRAYKNMRKFDDMDSQSADILDLEDELNSHDTPYERYEHTTDNGCTIFYDDYIKGQEFKNSDLTERETLYYKGKKFVVHYTVKDTYDAKEAFDSFKASISMIAPYDDADYYWARIYNGIIKYIYKGKVMRVNYYFNPEDMSDVDDWNLEDWYSGICDEVVQSLYESNKSIESKMVHN